MTKKHMLGYAPGERLEFLIDEGGLHRRNDILHHLGGHVSAQELLAHLRHDWFQVSLLEHLCNAEPVRIAQSAKYHLNNVNTFFC